MRCYLLAGGAARRMGTPKQQLLFGDQTLLQRVASAATSFDETVLVTRPASILQQNPPPLLRVIHDHAHGDTAPIFGLQRSLEDAAEKGDVRAWVLAVDYPLISRELLIHLRSLFESSDVEMFVPMANGQPQMLCAGYATLVLPEIRARIASGYLKIRSLAQSFRTEFLPEQVISSRFGPACLRSANTPQELEELRRIYEEAHAPR